MSHELRTPMHGVLGMTELLRRSGLDPEQEQLVKTLEASGQLLMTHLDSILDYSRLESGRLTFERRPVTLRRLVRTVGDLMAPRAHEAGLGFVVEVDPSLPDRIITDPTRLQQVLLNLTSNAVKFTQRGSVILRVAPSGEKLRFEVQDTGIGISPDAVERLFRPFEQADASTTRRFGGTGLGLSIVRGLVEGMGGQVGVHSELGEGSCFWVEIPLVAVQTEPRGVPSELVESESPTDSQVSLHVLVADDNPVNRLVAKRFLATLGHTSVEVEDGLEAVRAIEEQAFDVVLMDVHMPGLDGLEATRRIRATPHGQLPIVALTASAMREDRERCEQAGMEGFLSKPLTIPELAAVLSRWSHREPPGSR